MIFAPKGLYSSVDANPVTLQSIAELTSSFSEDIYVCKHDSARVNAPFSPAENSNPPEAG